MEQVILCDSEFPVRRGMQAAGRWLGDSYTEPLFRTLPLNSFPRMISRHGFKPALCSHWACLAQAGRAHGRRAQEV